MYIPLDINEDKKVKVSTFYSESTNEFLLRHILKQMKQIISCTWNFEIRSQKWLKFAYKLRMASNLTAQSQRLIWAKTLPLS